MVNGCAGRKEGEGKEGRSSAQVDKVLLVLSVDD